jgi:hypothetical protein
VEWGQLHPITDSYIAKRQLVALLSTVTFQADNNGPPKVGSFISYEWGQDTQNPHSHSDNEHKRNSNPKRWDGGGWGGAEIHVPLHH